MHSCQASAQCASGSYMFLHSVNASQQSQSFLCNGLPTTSHQYPATTLKMYVPAPRRRAVRYGLLIVSLGRFYSESRARTSP